MVQFASRMDLLKGSEIRELLKLTAQPDIISFAGGMPAPELFPVEQMMEASMAVMKENGRVALQYSSTEGYPRLREQIAERMLAKNNIHTDKDHILVTSGSQQGLDFSARVFLDPGDVVLLDDSGELRVNGTLHTGEIPYATYPAEGLTYPYTVPEGYLFLLCDHRTQGRDSRHFGAVPEDSVAGKVITLLRRRGL